MDKKKSKKVLSGIIGWIGAIVLSLMPIGAYFILSLFTDKLNFFACVQEMFSYSIVLLMLIISDVGVIKSRYYFNDDKDNYELLEALNQCFFLLLVFCIILYILALIANENLLGKISQPVISLSYLLGVITTITGCATRIWRHLL